MTDLGGPDAAPTKRPAIILIVVLALVAVAAVVGVVLTRGDDGEDWNSLVGVDHESGEVVVLDEEGEEVERIDSGVDGAVQAVSRGSFVLVHDGDEETAVVDVSEAEVVWSDKVDGSPRWVDGTSTPLLVIGPPQGGEVRVVAPGADTDVELGAAAELDDALLAPPAVFSSPDGGVVAAADLRGDVSVVVDTAAGEAHSVDGRLVAVADDGVATIRSAGGDEPGTVLFFDREGGERGSAPVPAGARGGLLMTDDTTVVGVAENDEGTQVFRVSDGDDEPEVLGTLEAALVTTVAYAAADRLLVAGEDRSFLFDGDGETVAELEGRQTAPYAVAGDPDCFAVEDGDDLVIHDLESGDELQRGVLERSGYLQASVNGCTVAGQGLLLGPDGAIEVDDAALVVVAPDGAAAIVRGEGGVELVDLSDRDEEPIELDELVTGFADR